MKSRKKLISFFVAVSMLCSIFTAMPVSASDLPVGVTYYSNTNGNGESYIPGDNFVLEASSSYKASGNYSLHLAATTELSNVQMRIGIALKETLSTSTTYRVTGKAVRFSEYGLTTWWDNIHLRYGSSIESLTNVGTIACSDNYTSKGFADFSFDITPTSAASMLALYTWQGNYYIDDMSCKAVNSDGTLGEELLVNGGFEAIVMPEPEVYPKGVTYYSNTNGNGESYIPGENFVLEASSSYKASGSYSLHLATSKGELSNVQMRIGIALKETLSTSKTYRVTGKAVRFSEYGLTTWWDNIRLQYGSSLEALTNVGTIACSDNYESKGFANFSFDITPTSAASMLALYTWQGNYYIDDISCRVVNSDGTLGEELVINGGFENVDIDNYTELENVVAYSAMAANTATVSWTNPDIDISNVTIKLNDEAVSATVDTTAGAFNQVVLEGLTAGTTYDVAVSATINGVAKTYTSSFTATEERDWKINGIDDIESNNWSTILSDGSVRDGNTGYANTVVERIEEDDNSYVKFTGNIPTPPGNTYAGLQYKLEDLNKQYSYKLVFKAKGENVTNLHFMMEPITTGINFAHCGDVYNITNEWQTFEILLDDYTDGTNSSYDVNLQMISENFAGWFAIDDFEIYAYSGDALVDGTNLVENSTFDYIEPILWPKGVHYTSNGYVPGENYTIRAEYAVDYVKSGDYSLNFNASSGEISNTQIAVKIPLKHALETGKTYKVSYDMSRWARSSSWWSSFKVRLEAGNGSVQTVDSSLTDLADCGWISKSYEVTATVDAINLQFWTWSGDYSVDNLSVVEVKSNGTYGEELVLNGGFENVVLGEPEYIIYPENIYYWSNGYVPGENYTIQAESTEGYVKSGSYALNFNTSSGQIDNVQIAVKIPLRRALTEGKTYKVSYDMSRWSRSSSWWNSFNVQWEAADGSGQRFDSSLTDLADCGWISKSYEVTAEVAATSIQFYTWQGDYSVDNLSIVEKNADGTYGTYDFVRNGDFEYVTLEAPGTVIPNPEVIIGDPIFSLNDTVAASLKQGTMKVSVNVENVNKLALIITLYKDQELQGVTFLEKETDGSAQEYETALIVPDMSDADYRAKVMYWNSLSELEPLRSSYTIKEAVQLGNGTELEGYEVLDYEPIMSSYWYSTNNLEIMGNNTSFVATKQFSKSEIPVGSIIEVKSGWQYRPEGWISLDTLATSRPDNVKTEYVDVTKDWWGSYNWRAFNISKTAGGSITDPELVKANFKIYVPVNPEE